jgi:hypothetical protein
VKFGLGYLHLLPFSSCQFSDKLCSENPYFTWGVNKICSRIFYVFCPVWIKFGTADVRKTLFSGYEFSDNWRNQNHTLVLGINEFIPTLSIFIAESGSNSV